ncbi:hypothetical protein BOTU111921_06000 [Bordetella tumbae]
MFRYAEYKTALQNQLSHASIKSHKKREKSGIGFYTLRLVVADELGARLPRLRQFRHAHLWRQL